ncbi:PLP-dependent aminotransferase family protein [Alicyclobacillus fastidiosus]|uniref:PLP-dependent aminotransferase family protein n=1 Tax=Alicyclobacillus fastidiosus TaxID=392011 RepID=A0ABY6ZAQ7_9BACL|nr:PLP-dependent aminotransferase family protein [Alicyclobacillus fastidiosus]WAH39964.1 PLP-dependent aminotransferase family protein [Alicyclobacillus fastidiosus]GMA61245.1 aminotransferase [Alicyclobacillus fastidiosus]
MQYRQFLTDAVRASLQYEAPGGWIPAAPPACIRLHSGYPAPALVPVDHLARTMADVLERERDLPLQYLGSPSAARLRGCIEHLMSGRGIDVSHDATLVTSGSAEAIDLISRTCLDSASVVVVESPTYMEALETFHNYTDQVLCIPVDGQGLRTDLFEHLLVHRQSRQLPLPKLLYTIPSFHNPTGITLSLERRNHLLQLARRFRFLIVEDDAYGELYFEKRPTTLKELDLEGNVLYLGSLSKVIAPGLRIGWVTGPSTLISTFDRFKKDLGHPLVEAVVARYLALGDWNQRMTHLRGAYRRRRDVLQGALAQYMPGDVTWVNPEGGYFTWLHVPGVNTLSMLPRALAAGVSYVAGEHFCVNPKDGAQNLRLSFSYVDEEDLVRGVQLLSDVIRATRSADGSAASGRL